jgi:organic hydroperoxide reductase OsmC/OhrA
LVQGKEQVSQTTSYQTIVQWKGEQVGHIQMGNGPEMDFSAPPDAHGLTGVLTPEDAFVAAVNSCIMMMFLWSCERLKLNLVSYRCRAEGTKLVELDHTESFTQVCLYPEIQVKAGNETVTNIEARIQKALQSAKKYSLVANSIKTEVIIQPLIKVVG